ncbi:MAG: alpha/beta fold hydrolase, partial [Candidatus Heimdallarchaeota archaeon]|nr:alpha/beta fold hydrolase [Candidatus Heimdallarchaeota archaeon]MCK4877078.1 alpha/beta fold hydrolase [Candidatus Heimdallarchaeota archaeon]
IEEWYRPSYVDALKQDYQLILIDLRGHGLSDKPHNAESYSLKIIASDVIAVLDDLKIDKAHFWGYSMGGNVGLGLIRFYVDRFLSFIIGGMTPQAGDKLMEDNVSGFLKKLQGGAEAFFSGFRDSGMEITKEIEEIFTSYDFEALAAFWGGDIFYDSVESLQQLEVPCLLYVGEEDEWGHYPRAKETAKIIPNIEVVSFRNQGHGVHEQKELVLPEILKFLDNIK